jgi:hypothetical protein
MLGNLGWVQFSNGVLENTHYGPYPWWGGAEFIILIGGNSASGSLWAY